MLFLLSGLMAIGLAFHFVRRFKLAQMATADTLTETLGTETLPGDDGVDID